VVSFSTLFLLLTVLFLMRAPAAPPAFDEAERRRGPVEALRTAMNASDTDAAVDLFTDDAVLIQPRIGGMPQVYVGREQIRWWMRQLVRATRALRRARST
jgi:hypothetical protein